MSIPSEPSAGTARPDAAPSDTTRELFKELADFLMSGIYPTMQMGNYQAWADSVLTRLAEREAECERLRKDAARLDWLESAVPSGQFREVLNAMPTSIWNGSVRALIDAAMSAAVAPAAREPNTETSEADHV